RPPLARRNCAQDRLRIVRAADGRRRENGQFAPAVRHLGSIDPARGSRAESLADHVCVPLHREAQASSVALRAPLDVALRPRNEEAARRAQAALYGHGLTLCQFGSPVTCCSRKVESATPCDTCELNASGTK